MEHTITAPITALASRMAAPALRGLGLACLAVAAAAPAAAQMGPMQPEPAITTQGMAEVRIASDRARLAFIVETQARTAREAAQQNSERMDRVVRALRDAGGTTVTVETGGYELHPVYSQPGMDRDERFVPTIEAYRAVNHVNARADDVTRVGGLIDAAIGAGANRISSLRFEAKDPEPARLEAVRQAVGKARAEAQAAAEALGVTLGMPLEVNVGMDYYAPPPPMPMYREAMAMDMAQSAPTPIEAAEQVVRANVSVRYRIAP
jgi:uncharacterized protein YggE